jgi:hypothetical protein
MDQSDKFKSFLKKGDSKLCYMRVKSPLSRDYSQLGSQDDPNNIKKSPKFKGKVPKIFNDN